MMHGFRSNAEKCWQLSNYPFLHPTAYHILDRKNVEPLTGAEDLHTEPELRARCYEIVKMENYCKSIVIEANTMVDMAEKKFCRQSLHMQWNFAKQQPRKSLNEQIDLHLNAREWNPVCFGQMKLHWKIQELKNLWFLWNQQKQFAEESAFIRDQVLVKCGTGGCLVTKQKPSLQENIAIPYIRRIAVWRNKNKRGKRAEDEPVLVCFLWIKRR